MRLISKEDLRQVARVSFASKSFDSVLRLALRFFQGLMYNYVVYIFAFFIFFGLFIFMIYGTEAYSEPCQTSKMRLFEKKLNN